MPKTCWCHPEPASCSWQQNLCPHRLALPIRQKTHLPIPTLLATGIFRAAQKLYLLFQHHTTPELAAQQGYLFGGQNSCHCFLRQLGATVAVLGLDLRARRSSQGCCPPQVMLVMGIGCCVWSRRNWVPWVVSITLFSAAQGHRQNHQGASAGACNVPRCCTLRG